ncbi:MAG: tRNA pseudouridine(38-40) synthase TruA [Anaerohalosphaeraceae bacterium]
MDRRKIKLTIQYNGSRFHGWAAQPGLPTIQGTIEEAFEKLCGQKVEVVGSSRTDAGVHALGQVAHAVLADCPVPTANLQKALNRLLPEDIAVAAVEEVPDSFDAVSDTRSKLYRYTIHNGSVRPVLEIHRCWHYPYPLDIGAMQQAAERLLGTRDFKSFASAGDQRLSSVRTVTLCRVQSDPPWITVDIAADGFLYNMVRNIVGTLVEIGRGRWRPEEIDRILEAKDRAAAGPIAPPGGLCLMEIFY